MVLLSALTIFFVIWIALASPLNGTLAGSTDIVPRSQRYLPSTSAEGATSSTNPRGIDVSGHQRRINWRAVKSNGIAFAYIKATEGIRFKNSEFNSQYAGATNVGLIRGSYHFARPDVSTGAVQATYFVANGGGWSSDGITLPGALDIEYNPYGATCYGKTRAAMVSWIRDFSNTYKSKTGVYPVIYTTTDWWKACTGNNRSFGSTNPLWVARYATSAGALPNGWRFYTFWQYSNSASPNPGDADIFNGNLAGLKR